MKTKKRHLIIEVAFENLDGRRMRLFAPLTAMKLLNSALCARRIHI